MSRQTIANSEVTHLASFPELNPNPVLEMDLQGRINYVNPAARRLFPNLETLGLSHRFLHGLGSSPQSLSRGKKTWMTREREVNGQWFEQVVHYIPEIDKLRIYAIDITQIKSMEAQLRASESRYRRLFEAAQDGILILNARSGEITDVNPGLLNMLGYSRDEMLGKRLWDIGAFKNVAARKPSCARLSSNGYIRYENFPLTARNGRRLDVELVSNAYLDNDQRVIQCNIRDISERTKLNQFRASVLRTVSHDLRNPLAIVKTGICGLLYRVAGEINKDQEGLLNVMNYTLDRLTGITENLLDISNFGTGAVEPKQEPVNFSDLVSQVALIYSQKAKSKGLELRARLPDQEVVIHSDQSRLFQVLSNLVGNAIKFTAKGHIDISVTEKKDRIECAVTDTGRGIAREDVDKLFREFTQVGKALSGPDKGLGLGLAIAKDIITLYKGNIWVESSLGQGSRFIFTLPKNPS
ncbi:MAG TPA: hypothetical protein DEB40_07960 [Elusimicrobia bacterium]|nr:hypothetical protein [Elusimicrobiota bacterium]HBT61663.1 hypothetical protein [Elusimicrobiota bacterium]